MNPWESTQAQKILLYFLTNPKREHHLRELAELLGTDPGNLSREMAKLEAMGLFNTKTRGRLKLFSINSSHPLYKEIRGLTLKTQGPEKLLRSVLEKITGIKKAFLYGSFVVGKLDAKSDIDLMVIGDVKTLDLIKQIKSLEAKLGREIHYRIFTEKEFQKRQKSDDPFLSHVLKGKTIPLVE